MLKNTPFELQLNNSKQYPATSEQRKSSSDSFRSNKRKFKNNKVNDRVSFKR